MNETKICNKCGIEKQLTEENFIFRDRGNTKYWEGTCRECSNKARRKGIEYKPKLKKDKGIIVDGDGKVEYKINNKNRGSNMSSIFTDREIEALKSLVSKHNQLMSIVNNRVNFEKIEDIKIKKSITISNLNHLKILEIVKNTDKNYSQIVDSLIKSALENT